jgi:Holliday junction resolvase-like predicted endonuclease
VFVEVRRRASNRFGGAVFSVTPAKQQRLLRAAQLLSATLQNLAAMPLRPDRHRRGKIVMDTKYA